MNYNIQSWEVSHIPCWCGTHDRSWYGTHNFICGFFSLSRIVVVKTCRLSQEVIQLEPRMFSRTTLKVQTVTTCLSCSMNSEAVYQKGSHTILRSIKSQLHFGLHRHQTKARAAKYLHIVCELVHCWSIATDFKSVTALLFGFTASCNMCCRNCALFHDERISNGSDPISRSAYGTG